MIQNLDMAQLVSSIGYFGILAIIFLETGLFCFFLPGDSLLLAIGLLTAKGFFHPWILIPAMVIVSILGYMLSYWLGDKFGMWIMQRKDSLLFKRIYIVRAAEFYEKHGAVAVLFGRLVPIVRTFVPVAAGMAKMQYKRFTICNIIGSAIWAGGITLIGYFAGNLVPDIDKYLLPGLVIIVVLSILPGIVHYVKKRFKKKDA